MSYIYAMYYIYLSPYNGKIWRHNQVSLHIFVDPEEVQRESLDSFTLFRPP